MMVDDDVMMAKTHVPARVFLTAASGIFVGQEALKTCIFRLCYDGAFWDGPFEAEHEYDDMRKEDVYTVSTPRPAISANSEEEW